MQPIVQEGKVNMTDRTQVETQRNLGNSMHLSLHTWWVWRAYSVACCCNLAAACCAVFLPDALRGVPREGAAAAEDAAFPLLPLGAAERVDWVPFSPWSTDNTSASTNRNTALDSAVLG